MANVNRDPSHLSLPPLKADNSESVDSFYKSERPSSIPVPTRPVNTTPVGSRPPPPPSQTPGGQRPRSYVSSQTPHRFLSPAEWARVAHGLGAIKEGETHNVVHPSCWYWPPKGMPEGLYRDVVTQRSKYFISHHCLSVVRWFLMIFQIVIGAILTAMGSLDLRNGTPITVLAAVNTVDAGLLALMHNSGLPDRYRLDKVEFSKVEDFLKELLDTGIVEANQTVDDVLSECFAKYQAAKATVLANMPESYTIPSSSTREKQVYICPDPSVHTMSVHS
ncbi:hypothetical protein B0T24DRAFT_297288 [Lasiosphaeria ovina]|uniref:SMODS and SLOG-associating 2TM effector domain-containing protein n=1 Tax=Lasiosphaeria ovina TaxID=92902 RepID=A0AAE0N8B2_9PEZI|nr:hypothetical protein B0T24DRAFT_297288 [Lasiosphaeria ovina]